MDAYRYAASTSNPNDSAFTESFAPEATRELQIRIEQRAANGQSVRDATPSVAEVAVVSVNIEATSTASLITCEVDDRVVYRIADGGVVNDKVSTSRWSVGMTSHDGLWTVANRQQLETWDGEEMDACVDGSSY